MTENTSNFVLPDHLAERYREYANAIKVVARSEQLDAFTMCARLVAGMVSKDFPLREASDRLLATAQAYGMISDYGDDLVQARLAAAIEDPIVINDDMMGVTTSPTDRWIDPDWSIIDDRRGELPEFPVNSLPTALQPWIKRAAHGAGATTAHVAVPFLAIASSLIGTARRVEVSRSWSQPMTLWAAVVGFSGTSKTPGIDATKRALAAIERNREPMIAELERKHNSRVETAKTIQKKWKKEVEEAVEKGDTPPTMPAAAIDPGPFIVPRLYVSNATIERLAVLLQARPRGALMLCDELASLFLNMSRYSGGQDNEFWLECWNGNPYRVERMGRPAVAVDHLLVGVVGGMQPDKLAKSFDGAADGMYARVCFAWPSEPPYRVLTNEVAEIEPEVINAFTRIIDIPAEDDDGTFVARYVPLSNEARKDVLEEFRQFVHAGKNSLDGREREWWAKMPAHAVRLAGTLAYLDWSMRGGDEPKEIEGDFMRAAVRLVHDYFWPHSRAALRQIGLNERHANARRVLRWIKASKRRTEISREEFRRDALGQRLDAGETQDLIDGLVKSGWLREVTKSAGPLGGRLARRWLVNPMLFTAQTAETAQTSRTSEFPQFPQFSQAVSGNGHDARPTGMT